MTCGAVGRMGRVDLCRRPWVTSRPCRQRRHRPGRSGFHSPDVDGHRLVRSSREVVVASSSLRRRLTAPGRCSSAYPAPGSTSTSWAPPSSSSQTCTRSICPASEFLGRGHGRPGRSVRRKRPEVSARSPAGPHRKAAMSGLVSWRPGCPRCSCRPHLTGCQDGHARDAGPGWW